MTVGLTVFLEVSPLLLGGPARVGRAGEVSSPFYSSTSLLAKGFSIEVMFIAFQLSLLGSASVVRGKFDISRLLFKALSLLYLVLLGKRERKCLFLGWGEGKLLPHLLLSRL